MEFKYRAVDQRPSGHHPHSQHAIGADFRNPSGMRYAPDMGSSLANNVEVCQMQEPGDRFLRATNNDRSPNCVPNLGLDPIQERNSSLEVIQYEAIQRQLDKQQIREEIIASEIMRRRMLEAEVRRELEQEMALRHTAYGFRSQERFSMLFDQRFPFVDQVNKQLICEPWAFGGRTTVDLLSSGYPLRQIPEATQPGINSETSRSRVIFPAKPAPDLSGSKQKLILTPLEQCSQETLPARNKIPKEEYSCALCQVSATDAKGLNEHLQGKKHKMMEEKLIAEKIERKKPLNSMVLEGEAAGSEKGINEETDQKSIRPPLEALKDCDETSSWKNDGPQIVPSKEKSIQLSFEDPKVCNNNSARKEDEQMFVPKVEIRPKESNDKRKKSFKFWCEPCRVGTFSETAFEAHKKGKKHRLNVGSKEEATSDSAVTAAANNDNSTRKDDEPKFIQKAEIHPVESNNKKKNSFKFWCEPCGVGAFSETVFERHKKGKKHWLNFGSKEEAASDSAVTAVENNNNLGLPPEDMKICNDNSMRRDDGPEIVPKMEIHLEESNNEKKTSFKFWCEPCGVGALSETVFEEHKKGKKHWLNFGSKEEATSDSAVTAAKNNDNPGLPLEDTEVCNDNITRKDDGPEIVPKVEIRPEESNKKKKNIFKFWCEPCGVGTFSETVFEEHKKGKKHWLKLNFGSKEEATSDSAVTAAENNNNSGPPPEDMKVSNGSSDSSRKDDGPEIIPKVEICPEELTDKMRKSFFRFWCEPCRSGAFSETVVEGHKKGKEHCLNVRSKEEATSDCAVTDAENNNNPRPPTEDMKICNNSSSKDDGPKIVPEVEICPEESNNKRKRSFKFWCEPCGVGAFDETVFEAHRKGKKHRLHVGSKVEVTSDIAVTAAGNSDKSGPPPGVN